MFEAFFRIKFQLKALTGLKFEEINILHKKGGKKVKKNRIYKKKKIKLIKILFDDSDMNLVFSVEKQENVPQSQIVPFESRS